MEEKVISAAVAAAIAGLLHDVGKVEQRARSDPWTPAPGIEQEGQPVHATWSIDFIQHYVPARYRPAALAGGYHHRPDRSPAQDPSLSTLIALADKLSAGERADVSEGEKTPPRQMLSIFDRVTLPGQPPASGQHFLPLRPLALEDESIFPGPALADEANTQRYESLRDGLRQAARQDIDDPQVYLENLLGAFQRFAWSVPSAYYHSLPDVSLYDHSRMTAALAVCLADLPADQVQQYLQAVTRRFQDQASSPDLALLDRPLALLVGGDLSGGQSFLYTLSSKRAAQTLRGRSFYLQLLTEAVLRFVLAELDLPYTTVIYSGGGHFYLLAPFSAGERLPRVCQAISQKLLDLHGVALYLAIGSAPVPAAGFHLGRFPEYWDAMHRDLARAKQQRYAELGQELYALVFQPPEEGGNPDATCAVCGEDTRPVKVLKDVDETDTRRYICSLCSSFDEELGRHLPQARFVALGFGAPQETGGHQAGFEMSAKSALAAFGMQVQFLKSAGEKIDLPGARRLALWALEDPAGDRWPQADGAAAAPLLRHTVNGIPRVTDQAEAERINTLLTLAPGAKDRAEPGAPKLFNHLGALAEGIDRLGVLRMDVDDLGRVFQYGLGGAATLARLSTLSFQMSLYFEGWVKRLCEQAPYAGFIYAVYAGGDDVFLIGPWDRMPALAQAICDGFAAYTGQHPALHLSAGIAFIHGKYPVYQAAEDAAQALGQAKGLPGKSAISFLGRAWTWKEFAEASAMQARLDRIIAKPGSRGAANDSRSAPDEGLDGPQAILQILRGLAVNQAEAARSKQGQLVWGPWMWQGAYQLTRMAERYEKNRPTLAQAIKDVRDELERNNYGNLAQWGMAARWTQLKNRDKPYE